MASKYKVGDVVHCKREETEQFDAFDFVGEIFWMTDRGDYWEYEVTNAPIGLIGGFPIRLREEEIVGYA